MIGEILATKKLAEYFGFGQQLSCVLGIGEELPFADESFEGVYLGGCLHHTVTSFSVPEIYRVLKHKGRFAAADMWDAPLYKLGVRVLGKREEHIQCKPLNDERVAPIKSTFQNREITNFGVFTRYPLLALSKFGVELPFSNVDKIAQLDHFVSSKLNLSKFGSSIVCKGEK